MENEVQPNVPSVEPLIQIPAATQPSTKKLKIMLFIILGLVVVTSSVFIGIQIGKKQTPNKQSSVTQLTTSSPQTMAGPTALPTSTPTINPTADWKTYQDSTVGFVFKYPNDWIISKQGSETKPWIDISSPDRAPQGSQEPLIGISISIQIYNNPQIVTNNDLKELVSTDGVLKHYKVNTISESFITINSSQALRYEYEGIEPSYSFHFWGINVAKDKTVISIQITDFKTDNTLNGTSLAPQILSTFAFTD